jgi:hypothetical protein
VARTSSSRPARGAGSRDRFGQIRALPASPLVVAHAAPNTFQFNTQQIARLFQRFLRQVEIKSAPRSGDRKS